jgi:YfiH family protein
MSVTKVNPLFLYQTKIGSIATVSVTHNMGCLSSPYAGNLGLHVKDTGIKVAERRAFIQAALARPIQWLNQVHGTAVHPAQFSNLAVPTADACFTTESVIALAVMTADCLPVVITAQNSAGQRAVAIAHAGWRGLLNGVINKTMEALHHAVPNAQFHAHIGPCIGVAHFEVGAEVRLAFVQASPEAAQHFSKKTNGQYCCDLEGLARNTLNFLNVKSITGGGWCTVSDPRLASYRRQAITGRFATLVALN